METLGAYGSDDEATPSLKPEYRDYSMMAMVSAAPAVGMLSAGHVGSQLLRHDQKEISSNLPIEVLMAPVQGPANPFTFNSLGAEGGGRRVGMGVIEDAAVEDWTFDEQYQTYQRSGFAVDLTSNQVLGNYGEYLKSGGETAQTVRGTAGSLILSI
jgi:pre-mRNA-processing factor 17